MASEKELFVTKQYVPTGEPLVQNDHTVIYRVKCLAEPNKPDGILKMYRKKNLSNLYRTLYQLDYSYWPHLYAVKYFDENTLIVEELLKGMTLEEKLEKNRARGITFSEEEAHTLMEKICYNIQQLAKLNPPIHHHNLKPSNIFITDTGNVKFLDFIPAFKRRKPPLVAMIHSLGTMFHQMLTGKPPKNDKVIYKGRYADFIKKCLENNPTKQFTSIDELQKEMDIARKKEYTEAPAESAGLPYYLSYLFQGIPLLVEWILFVFFLSRDNVATASLFCIVFLVHSIVFLYQRERFLKKNNIIPFLWQRIVPIVIFIALMIVIYLIL